MVILQNSVFENLMRNIVINACVPQINMEEEVLMCREPFYW